MKFFKGRNYREELFGEYAWGAWTSLRAPGRFHLAGFGKIGQNTGIANISGFANNLQVWPVLWEQGRVIEQVGLIMSIVSGGGELGVCGVYENVGREVFPNRLLQASATFTLDAIGARVDPNFNFTVPRTDLYWLSFNTNATLGQFRGQQAAEYIVTPFGFNDQLIAYTQPFLSGAQAFGTPPSRLTPAVVAAATAGAGVGLCPIFLFR